MRLNCTHFQQIFNQSQTTFSVVYFATKGLQNDIAIQYSKVQEVEK